VVFVRMSAAQDSPERLPQVYLGSVRLLALAVFPPMAVVAGIGHTALPLLLSEPWRQVATIFALAAPGIALETATYTSDMVFQAVNRTGLRLRLVTERSLLKLAAIAVALPFGLNAVALAITLSAVAYLPRLWSQMRLVIRLDNRSALFALLPSVAGAALAWGMAIWLQAMTDGWATLAWSLPLLMLAWVATAAIQIRGLRAALSMFS
jgi:O-antigen/teichoic acid export membrane protein